MPPEKSGKPILASPSDVQPERNALAEVVDELNKTTAKERGLHIDLVRWETDVNPGFHIDGSQEWIDKFLKIEECDLLIGIFWKRFGKPTKDAKSGTEHEFRKAYEVWKRNGHPQLMIYFKEKTYYPNSIHELDQQRQVFAFKESISQESLYWKFTEKPEFVKTVRVHLARFIRDFPISDETSNNSNTIESIQANDKSQIEIDVAKVSESSVLKNTFKPYEPEEQTNDLPIDRCIKKTRAELFWQFYISHALRLSLMLIGEDIPRESVGLLLPLQPDAARLPVTEIEQIRLLGESLVGWLGHSRSTQTLFSPSPHFSFNSDYRIHPLRVMENNRPIEESSTDNTHIVVRRECKSLTLRPEVVEMIHVLLKPLYDDVERVRACFVQDTFSIIESSPNLDNTGLYPDIILNNLAEMIVRLGGSKQGKQRWQFCCILLPRDPSLPLQQRSLVVRAQSQDSPHKIGIASVSPTVEMSSLSLRAYQSRQICYRETVSPEDIIAFHDAEQTIQSAIAIPVDADGI